jgi:hypothetical protein
VNTRWTVEVTDADIQHGVRDDSFHCVVAVAIARTIPEAAYFNVNDKTIRFSLVNQRKRLRYVTPDKVSQYVTAFDAGDVLHPFTFQLRDPFRVDDMGKSQASRVGIARSEATRKAAQAGRLHKLSGNPKNRSYGGRRLRVNQEGK